MSSLASTSLVYCTNVVVDYITSYRWVYRPHTCRYSAAQYFCRQLRPVVTAAAVCRKRRRGGSGVIKELEQMCEKARSIRRRAAAAAAAAGAAAVPSVFISLRGRRRRLIRLK